MFEEFFSEFTIQIVVAIIIITGGSVFAYFRNLKNCFRTYKESNDNQMKIVDDRSLRLSIAFLHFVKRNDELHLTSNSKINLGTEIESLLKDPKTGKF